MTRSAKNEVAVYTLRIDRSRLDRLHEIAAADHRTVSQEIRRLIDERIAEAEREAA
jgi:predicted DNA-binding ribbon-helix-helix protein